MKDKMEKIYENDGKIKTKPVNLDLDDSLIHSDYSSRRGHTSESSSPNHENEIKQDDSLILFSLRTL